jgi:hypothetical protein
MRGVWIGLAGVAAVSASGWAGYRLWPRPIEFRPVAMVPVWERAGNRDLVTLPGRFLVAEISTYDDEFFAYLMFSYLRGAPFLDGTEVLLTYNRVPNGLLYAIQVRMPNDLLSSLSRLYEARAHGLIEDHPWRYVTGDVLDRLRYQTHLFLTAYSLPARRRLEDLTHAQLVAYIRRFVRFKSLTDPRIRRGIEPLPRPLTSAEARQLAEDIVAVADFYALPLDFFLGIGAMENNYMDVEGDLQHAIWKRRAQKGDVVLKRKAGRVLVVNSSLGVWQITRETLRYAHHLYRKDRRDYALLPPRLRPPEELDVANVPPEVLTTYAGLLFRDLLDRCDGDVAKAVGAYNGGLGKPNPRYAEGVGMVAEYARRIMEHAAVLNGPAAGRRFLSAGP